MSRVPLPNWYHWFGGPSLSLAHRPPRVVPRLWLDDMDVLIMNKDRGLSQADCVLSIFYSSEVDRSLMVRWVVGSILHRVDPLSYFSFQPELHDWCNKGPGMCYPVCGMGHIKEPLLLIDKSSLCGCSGFPFSLSEWSLTICLTPYNRR